jgi:hypothetical protein
MVDWTGKPFIGKNSFPRDELLRENKFLDFGIVNDNTI